MTEAAVAAMTEAAVAATMAAAVRQITSHKTMVGGKRSGMVTKPNDRVQLPGRRKERELSANRHAGPVKCIPWFDKYNLG
jgi:hypothetical protein